MVVKKKYYKQKLEEKKIEILKTLIEEEINLFLIEDKENIGQVIMPKGGVLNTFLSPLVDMKNAFAHAGAKAAVQLTGMAGLLVAGTIAGFLPFNDPRTVNFIARKIQYLEQENLKLIDKQFEKELGQMRDGWETFKNDFWGIGFVVSPLNAIAAIATAEKGLDMGLSVLNVVSGGRVGQVIDKINEDIKDPGSLKEYLGKQQEEDRRNAEERVKSAVESDRCFRNLQQAGFIDPSCIGADQRERFPANATGTAQFIKFVTRNVTTYNQNRKERYETQFPDIVDKKPYQHVFSDPKYNASYADSKLVSQWLKSNGYITETINSDEDLLIEEGFLQTIKQAVTGQRPQTGIPSLNALHQKIDGWVKQGQIKADEAKELFTKLKNNFLQNPEIKKASEQWSAVNISKMITSIFTNVNNDIARGKAGKVTPQEIDSYKDNAEKLIDKMFDAAAKKSKKFKVIITQAAKKAAQQAIKNSMARMPAMTSTQPQPTIPQQNSSNTAQPQQAAVKNRPAAQPTQVQPAQQSPAVPTPIAPQALPRR